MHLKILKNKYIRIIGKYLLLAFILHIIIEIISRKNIGNFLSYMYENIFVFLYNTVIILYTFLVVILVKRKAFYTVLISMLWLCLGIVNSVLLVYRVTPFSAVDLKLVKDAFRIMGNYFNLIQIILITFGMILLIFSLSIYWKKTKLYKNKLTFFNRVACVAISTFTITLVTFMGISNEYLAQNFGNIVEAYNKYGFAYCFANSLINTGIRKPKNYSEDIIKEIVEEEMLPEKISIKVQKSNEIDELDEEYINNDMPPNIIFLQLESFFDPTHINDIEISEDPIPNYRKLLGKYSSGYLSVPSVGAGTVNTEFEIITGMNLDFFGPGEYPYMTVLQNQVCESIAFNLNEIDYTSHVIHNNEGTFYERHEVLPKLGFNTFTPIEYMDNYKQNTVGWVCDDILISQIGKALSSTAFQDFIYTISVQGHGAYPTDKELVNGGIEVTGAGVFENEERKVQLDYYVNEINKMDMIVKEIVEFLDKRGEPYILVMYGDHLPALDITADKLDNGSLYQTQYVICNNIGLEKLDKDLEAYQLSAWVFNLIGLQIGTITRYHQYYFENEEDFILEDYIENMRIMEYDMLYGKSELYEGEFPYEATDLKFGISEVKIREVSYDGEKLIVYGKNFNIFSKIMINDKPLETELHNSSQLSIQLDNLKKSDKISVAQIGRDRIILGVSKVIIWEN
jgi:Phosphoglycerol transferase and related proteins, alkaline phosphatase superfamily